MTVMRAAYGLEIIFTTLYCMTEGCSHAGLAFWTGTSALSALMVGKCLIGTFVLAGGPCSLAGTYR